MRIGVDIDDVLFPWFDLAHEACLRAGITNGVKPTSWVMYEDYGCTKREWLDALEYATSMGMYRHPPITGALDGLKLLTKAGHEIHLVTARGFFKNGDTIKRETVWWLEEYGVPHKSLTFSQDKTLVNVDVFVDDSERNIKALTEAGTLCCLIEAPHNAHVQHYWKANSLATFAQHILLTGGV